MSTQSLGRGLQSLIPKKGSGDSQMGSSMIRPQVPFEEGKAILEIAPAKIRENPHQPRKYFDESGLNDLVESIRVHGLLQPLVVTPLKEGEYELVAGERRLRAAKLLHLKSVPVIVRTVGELEKLELALIENIQRKDLNPIERAVAYRKLVDEFSLTHEEAAKRMGKSRVSISNTLRLLQLPGVIQKALGEGKLSEGQAKVILELSSEEKRLQLFERVQKEGLTVRDVEKAVRKSKVSPRGGSAFEGISRKVIRNTRFHDFEEQLSGVLGTKVSFREKGKGGVIEIEWFEEEDLIELVKRLSKG